MPGVTTTRWWGVVIAAVVFAAGAALLWWPGMRGLGARDDAPAEETSQPTPPDPAAEYLAFVDGLQPGVPPGDEAIVAGLRALSGALGTLDGVPPDVAIDLRIVAEHILLNPDSPETTAVVRASLVTVADTIDRDGGAAAALRPAVDAIDPRVPLADQRGRMIQVFVGAAEGIREEAQDVR